MLSKVIEWSARNVVLVLIATVLIVAAGIYSVLRTPVDALPDLLHQVRASFRPDEALQVGRHLTPPLLPR